MRYKVIFAVFVILLMAMCMGQKEVSEQQEVEEESPPPDTKPPIPDDVIKELIYAYFDALNQRNLSTLTELTHPLYVLDVQPFLEYVSENNISFELVSISLLMEEEEYREMMKNLSDAEFAQKVGKRGVSYELVLIMTKQDKSYSDCPLFIELGETDDGWKVLDPAILHMVIESYLEVVESEGS